MEITRKLPSRCPAGVVPMAERFKDKVVIVTAQHHRRGDGASLLRRRRGAKIVLVDQTGKETHPSQSGKSRSQ
jgi:hypothetical protein